MMQLNLFSVAANSDNTYFVEGLTYVEDFISPEQESDLVSIIDSQPWLIDLKRRVQHYGYRYNYKSRSVDISLYLGDLPNWLLVIAEQLKQENYLNILPDQVIINEYQPSQGISPHVDCVNCFTDTIISISLGSSCMMDFINCSSKEKKHLFLKPRSLVILKAAARYEWMHGIPSRKTDIWEGIKVSRKRRISLTFRKMLFPEL
jgi:alkylated DNA repair dioxygenase AlkB